MMTTETKTKTYITYRGSFRKKKIQGRKSKTREFTGTIYIFKPIFIYFEY